MSSTPDDAGLSEEERREKGEAAAQQWMEARQRYLDAKEERRWLGSETIPRNRDRADALYRKQVSADEKARMLAREFKRVAEDLDLPWREVIDDGDISSRF